MMNATGHWQVMVFKMQEMRRLGGSVSLELDSETLKGILNPIVGSVKIWLLISQLNLSIVSLPYSIAICCKFFFSSLPSEDFFPGGM